MKDTLNLDTSCMCVCVYIYIYIYAYNMFENVSHMHVHIMLVGIFELGAINCLLTIYTQEYIHSPKYSER